MAVKMLQQSHPEIYLKGKLSTVRELVNVESFDHFLLPMNI